MISVVVGQSTSIGKAGPDLVPLTGTLLTLVAAAPRGTFSSTEHSLIPAARRAIMADLHDGQTAEIQGSGSKPYVLKNVGGVYSCSCPAWRNQSVPIERRTCKHLRKFRGEEAEQARLGAA